MAAAPGELPDFDLLAAFGLEEFNSQFGPKNTVLCLKLFYKSNRRYFLLLKYLGLH